MKCSKSCNRPRLRIQEGQKTHRTLIQRTPVADYNVIVELEIVIKQETVPSQQTKTTPENPQHLFKKSAITFQN